MNPTQQELIWTFDSDSHEATQELGTAIGREIARAGRGAETLLLEGTLGAGKTCFTGGLARGLGIEEPAVSPTFVILRSYQGKSGLWLHHFDFYRFGGPADLDTVGYEDCLGKGNVVLVEWPERCPQVLADATLILKFSVTGKNARRIEALAGSRAGDSGVGSFRP